MTRADEFEKLSQEKERFIIEAMPRASVSSTTPRELLTWSPEGPN